MLEIGGEANLRVDENMAFSSVIPVTDPLQSDNLVIEADGPDAAIVTVSGRTAVITLMADFENPADADADGIYIFRLVANNGQGDVAKDFTLTVVDVPESDPVLLVDPGVVFFEEHSAEPVMAVALRPGSSPPGSYRLAGADAALFAISGDGSLSFRIPPDFERPQDGSQDNSYAVTVTAAFAEVSAGLALVIRVTDVAEIALPLTSGNAVIDYREHTSGAVALISQASGASGGFSLPASSDNQHFSISGGGRLSFASAPDFEQCLDSGQDCTYSVDIAATGSVLGQISVRVTDHPRSLFGAPGMERLSAAICESGQCQSYRDAAPLTVIADAGPAHLALVENVMRLSSAVELAPGEGPFFSVPADGSIQTDQAAIAYIKRLIADSGAEIVFNRSVTIGEDFELAAAFPNSVFVYGSGNDSEAGILSAQGLSRVDDSGAARRYYSNADGQESEITDPVKLRTLNSYFALVDQKRILVVGGSNESIGQTAAYEGGLSPFSNSNLFAEASFVSAPFITVNPDGTKVQGTSFSTPQVVAAVSAIRRHYPQLTAKELIRLIPALAVAKENSNSDTRDIPPPGALDLNGLFDANGRLLSLLRVRALIMP